MRDVLATGESLTIRSEVSALIFITAGVAIATDGSEIPTGATRAIVGETTLTNGGDVPAVVLAVIIGNPVDAATSTTTTPEVTVQRLRSRRRRPPRPHRRPP